MPRGEYYVFFSFADAPYAALALKRAMGLYTEEKGPVTMPDTDFLPDHMGVADSQSAVTLRDVAFAGGEADRGFICVRSGRPAEISSLSAREHYDEGELVCQTCRRCQ